MHCYERYLERKLQHFYRYSMTTFPYKKGNYSLFAVSALLFSCVRLYDSMIIIESLLHIAWQNLDLRGIEGL